MPELEQETLRGTIRDVLNGEGRREKIAAMVDSAFELKRLAWAHCPNCRKQVRVEIPDLKGTIDALTSLLAEAEGKPGTVDAEAAGVKLIVERTWPDAA